LGSGEQWNTTLSLVDAGRDSRPRAQLAIRWLTGKPDQFDLLSGMHLAVGRGGDVEIRVDSAGVSRRHAELSREGPLLALRDLASRNGTFLNGRRIAHAALSESDVVRFGDALGVVERIDPEQPTTTTTLGGALFGPHLAGVLRQIERAAPSDLPIVIVGETGVGKECVARAVHQLSGRQGPFHAVNCAALPTALAEAELFGHRRGAFTGAEKASVGQVRAAQGGTLLLDELADLSLAVQAKLLRVLQERQVTPLGDTQAVSLDVRFLAACQVDLAELVASKRLRQDLAARLSGVCLTIPPLRQRRGDIGYLFGYFLRQAAGGRPPAVDVRVLERLLLFDWRDNVRQLELLTRQLVVMHGHEPLLTQTMLPESLGRSEQELPTERPSLPAADRKEHDLQALQAALQVNDGNVSRAAAQAGISRQRAYRLLNAPTATTSARLPSEDDAEREPDL
jgi:two-component system response regulator AtoC